MGNRCTTKLVALLEKPCHSAVRDDWQARVCMHSLTTGRNSLPMARIHVVPVNVQTIAEICRFYTPPLIPNDILNNRHREVYVRGKLIHPPRFLHAPLVKESN